MDFMDLDSFRQRYSDITVTAVPSVPKSSNSEENIDEVENNTVEAIQMAPPTPLVEILPVGAATFAPSSSHNTRSKLQQQQKVADATAYANEYKQVLAKLEYTKFVQAQLQIMTLTTNGAGGGNSTETPNIVDAYGSLLRTIAEMQSNLGPTTIGLRAPKERLLRDIAQARVLVRECILLLMRDQQQTVIVEEATQRQ